MKFEIPNKYSNAATFSRPISKRPFSGEEVISLLRQGASVLYPPDRCKTAHSRILTQIRLFHRFLELSKKTSFLPDESLLEEFRSYFEKGGLKDGSTSYSSYTINSVIDNIRRCLNDFCYARNLIDRPVLIRKVYLKYCRFFRLSRISQKLIVAFEEDGRWIASKKKFFEDSQGHEYSKIEIQRKEEKLSAYNRKSYIDKVLKLLDVLEEHGIEDLTEEDLRNFFRIYQTKGKAETGESYLAALYSVIANGRALRILQKNPFDNFPLAKRKHKSRQDFVMPNQIDKLLDLESLDWNNSDAVRERCIATFIYDTGLRASTVAQLEIEDIKELPDARYQITVRGVSLKGNKEDKIVYVLFQETIPLLRYWIHVTRPKLNPKTNHLFVSLQGKKLTKSGIRNIVRNCSRSLDIETVKRRIPSPHTLRHTLATLNIEPFGKSLSPRLMQQRLIHMDLETLIKNYVHNNPLAEMEEYKKLLEKGSINRILSKISREEFFEILNSLTAARPGSISDIKRAYELERKRLWDESKRKTEKEEVITESEAVKRLSSFGIDYRSLRTWGLKEGICYINKEGSESKYLYQGLFIKNLSQSYIEKEEAFRKFHGSRASFYRRIKMCQIVKIGQKFFISKDDFLRFLVEEKLQTKNGKDRTQISQFSTPSFQVRRFATSF